MTIAALILGILGGLSGLSLAATGHVLIAMFGGSGGSLLYLLPLASLLGGGVALSRPDASALLLLLTAAAWFLIGAHFGYGVNFITIATILLNGVGGLLALIPVFKDNASHPLFASFGALSSPAKDGAPQARPSVDEFRARLAASRVGAQDSPSRTRLDRDKWNALLRFDPDIATVADKLMRLGPKWVDEFGAAYLALNDKSYLPNIVQKLLREAREEEEAQKRWDAEAPKRRAEEQKAQEERQKLEELQRQSRRQRTLQILRYLLRSAKLVDFVHSRPFATSIIVFAMMGCLAIFTILLHQRVTTYRAMRDPYKYCEIVRDIDAPDERYHGSKEIETLAALRDERKYLWRCMHGAVHVCIVVDSSDHDCDKVHITSGMRDYCSMNPGAPSIPSSLVGSRVDWRCSGTDVAIDTPIDARGFDIRFWTPQLPK
jgi:hypothetical protein